MGKQASEQGNWQLSSSHKQASPLATGQKTWNGGMGRSPPYIYIYILMNKRKRQIEGEALCSIPLWDDRDWAPFSITGPSTPFLLFYLWMIGWCVFCSQAHCLLNKKNKEKYILYVLVYIYTLLYVRTVHTYTHQHKYEHARTTSFGLSAHRRKSPAARTPHKHTIQVKVD